MTRNDFDPLVDDHDDDLPPHLRALLADHTSGPALSAAAERRLLARVVMSVGAAAVLGAGTAAGSAAASSSMASTSSAVAGAAASTATATASATTVGAFTSAVAFKVALGVMGVAGVVGAAVGVVGTARTARDETVVTTTASNTSATPAPAAPAAVLVLPPSPPPAIEPPAAPAPAAVVVDAPRSVSGRSAAPVASAVPAAAAVNAAVAAKDTELDEVAALAVVRDTLAAGHAQQALSMLDGLDEDAASTRFAEERLALRVIALSRAGFHEQAAALSTTFFARFPDSLLTARVQAAVTATRPAH